jgi:hypothetical protein
MTVSGMSYFAIGSRLKIVAIDSVCGLEGQEGVLSFAAESWTDSTIHQVFQLTVACCRMCPPEHRCAALVKIVQESAEAACSHLTCFETW